MEKIKPILKDVFVARQPIFYRQGNVFAYELLFRSTFENVYHQIDGDLATLKVVSESFNLLGLKTITNNKKAFVNFTRNLLLNGTAFIFPRETLIVEILENIIPDQEIIAACKDLKMAGYKLALDDFTLNSRLWPLVEIADILKVDFMLTDTREREDLVDKLGKTKTFLLAEKVETPEERQEAMDLGFSYFQGYFYSKPVIITGKNILSLKTTHLNILREISDSEFEVSRIEKAIKNDVSMSYKLLRFINSAAYGYTDIHSIRQALTLLGIDEIKKWISMVVLTEMAVNKPEELIVTSLIRATFCDLLGTAARAHADCPGLFLLGLFSLIDTLLNMPMKTILKELPLSKEIKAALLGENNRYRPFLDHTIMHERADWSHYSEQAARLKVDEKIIPGLYYQALEWADRALPLTEKRSNPVSKDKPEPEPAIIKIGLEVLSKIIDFHEDIDKYLKNIDNIQTAIMKDSSRTRISELDDIFNNNLEKHFEFEELIVFPAVLEVVKSISARDIIAQLLKEHKKLLKLTRGFRSIVATRGNAPKQNMVLGLHKMLDEIRAGILSHAELENQRILPLVRQDKAIRFLMGRKFLHSRRTFDLFT